MSDTKMTTNIVVQKTVKLFFQMGFMSKKSIICTPQDYKPPVLKTRGS